MFFKDTDLNMHKYIKIHMCVCGCIYTPTTAHSNRGNFPIGKNNNPLNIFQITVARRWVGPRSHFPPQGPDFVPCWSSCWKMHLVVSAGSQAAVCASHNAITQSDLCVGWRQVRRETRHLGTHHTHPVPASELPPCRSAILVLFSPTAWNKTGLFNKPSLAPSEPASAS